MQLIDLFSGIGGFSIGGEILGWKTVCFCENASFPQLTLNRNFPTIPIHEDVRTLTRKLLEQYGWKPDEPTIITAGFPCQPFSVAGKQKGMEDERWLWDALIRLISEVRPAYFVGENVYGLLTQHKGLAFETICSSLEKENYTVQSFSIPAVAKDAIHRRNRVWIIAKNSLRDGLIRPQAEQEGAEVWKLRNVSSGIGDRLHIPKGSIAETYFNDYLSTSPTFSPIYVADDGICGELVRLIQRNGSDCYTEEEAIEEAKAILETVRTEAIRCAGNSIVPQVFLEIGKAIEYDYSQEPI